VFPPRCQPLVVTVHDTVRWTHSETLTPRGVRRHRTMITRAACTADPIVVPSEAVRVELGELLPGSRDRTHVLGACVSPALLAEPDGQRGAEVTRRLRLPEAFLLSLATLEPRKGLDVLVKALAALPDGPPLLVVGQLRWGNVELAATVRQVGLRENRVRILGRLCDGELGVVLRRATLLVAPSRAEGFGLPVAEAMAVGTPDVCSDAPALVEIAAGPAAVVPRDSPARLADLIGELLGDAAARRRMVVAGLARAPRFDWDELAHRAWRLYQAGVDPRVACQLHDVAITAS
jgi:glycosyltransferase involved in cell wall biosynthesis